MTPIADILKLPDKCPVKQVQGKMVDCYENKPTSNGKMKQDFVIEDGAGNRLRCSAWEHSGLDFYKGKELIINEGPKGGCSVNIYNGKTGLSISRTCTFQLLAVHQASQPGAGASGVPATATQEPAKPANPVRTINGAKIGMALNNSVLILQSSGKLQGLAHGQILNAVGQMASDIIRMSDWMEQGNLYEPLKKDEPIGDNPY